MREYSEKKYICERIVENNYKDKSFLIIRPYYLCGPYDNTNRFDYSEWPKMKWKNNGHKLEYDNVIKISKKIVELMEDKKTLIWDFR